MLKQTFLSTLVILVVVFLAAYLLPWSKVNWGKVSMQPSEVVTVTGYADSQEGNQQATFTAGVSALNDDKQAAVDEVNNKVNDIVNKVKGFGVPEADIKTQNMSIYQNQESYMEDGVTKYRLGQWNISNNVEVILRDVSKANGLADLLASTGANNVWGPNFTAGDSRDAQKALLAGAIEDARGKAEEAAKAAGKKLGKVLSVVESSAGGMYPVPMYAEGMGGGGAGLQPGTSTVSQSVVVTFELK